MKTNHPRLEPSSYEKGVFMKRALAIVIQVTASVYDQTSIEELKRTFKKQ
jgi:hypothetical protein